MLRYHKAAKTLCMVLPNDSDHEWTWQGKICQNSYMGFQEEDKGALKPILQGEEWASD